MMIDPDILAEIIDNLEKDVLYSRYSVTFTGKPQYLEYLIDMGYLVLVSQVTMEYILKPE